MTSSDLVLSLFPGIGLFDKAFETVGYCVVRGPDLIWGGNIKAFHAPAGRFDGIIGGPPCQFATGLKNMDPEHVDRYGNQIPEFERIVGEASPAWFLMENVAAALAPAVHGYSVCSRILNNRHLGQIQNRVRRFSFGTRDGRPLHIATEALEPCEWAAAVTSAHGGERRQHFNKGTGGKIQRYKIDEALELQGFSWLRLFEREDRCPIKREWQLRLVAQGVPWWMGLAVARAVQKAMDPVRGPSPV